MDVLNEADRDTMREILEAYFASVGTTDQFIVIAFGKDLHVSTIHFGGASPDSQLSGMDVEELLRRVVEGRNIEDALIGQK